jgi:hypothetical protein
MSADGSRSEWLLSSTIDIDDPNLTYRDRDASLPRPAYGWCILFDQLVREDEQRGWHLDA